MAISNRPRFCTRITRSAFLQITQKHYSESSPPYRSVIMTTERRKRSNAEIETLLARHPDLKSLYDSISTLDGIEIEPDGKKSSIFHVYLSGRQGRFQAFLWILTPLYRSYVQWAEQPDPDGCRTIWKNMVKAANNPNGSELKNTRVEAIVAVTKMYVSSAAAK